MSALHRALLAEFVGTAMLVAAVVGSGIMADRLSTDVGLVLLQNTFATFGALIALIHALGPVSGAHFNPVVSAVDHAFGGIERRALARYVPVQVAGAVLGGIVANLMFELDAVDWSTKSRDGAGIWLGEGVATFGLVLVIFSMVRTRRDRWIPLAVAGYIGGAYYFTSSTSFANPAVTVGRMVSDTFAGIDPADAPMFVVAQLLGGALGAVTARALYPDEHEG
jgi:glycerol uptake facilitator-like aquaporin